MRCFRGARADRLGRRHSGDSAAQIASPQPGEVGAVTAIFQEEHGIRDVAVTGVQTCALPIFTSNSWEYTGDGMAPASYARAMPSPVYSQEFEVIGQALPMPPVAMTTDLALKTTKRPCSRQ